MSAGISVERIWENGEHCAFTDLIRFRDFWLCSFRESDSHAHGRDGILRVIGSRDGRVWKTVTVFALEGFDLREARFSVMPDGRLILVLAVRVFREGSFRWLQSLASFTVDGENWSPLQISGPPDVWIWRPCWHLGLAYTWSRRIKSPGETGSNPFYLMRSADGLQWDTIASAPMGNEASVYFGPDGTMYCLGRQENAVLGESAPPYTNWEWYRLGYFIGGPNWIELSDGRLIAGGRNFSDPGDVAAGRRPSLPKMVLALVDLEAKCYVPTLVLPSGGDCSYPGFVEHEGDLWVSYYSSHEGSTSIYLARVPLTLLGDDLSADIPPSHSVGPDPAFSGAVTQELLPA